MSRYNGLDSNFDSLENSADRNMTTLDCSNSCTISFSLYSLNNFVTFLTSSVASQRTLGEFFIQIKTDVLDQN